MKEKLSQEDLEKLKHWVYKVNQTHCLHCGEKCVIPPKNSCTKGTNKV